MLVTNDALAMRNVLKLSVGKESLNGRLGAALLNFISHRSSYRSIAPFNHRKDSVKCLKINNNLPFGHVKRFVCKKRKTKH